jgi:hypothetical protein
MENRFNGYVLRARASSVVTLHADEESASISVSTDSEGGGVCGRSCLTYCEMRFPNVADQSSPR